ncbi:hypothetical protein GCM10023210_15290 [Chryseobacterium ginsengisoli]|uniref:Uncharacterized protein n=1 Tax=Chryseobacterium ginsengisoli TaxID=363853 RepID=A0ABP9M641_9FLAO
MLKFNVDLRKIKNGDVEIILEITNTNLEIPYTLRKIEITSYNTEFESYKLEFISNNDFKLVIPQNITIKQSILLSDFKEDFIYSIMLDDFKENFYHHNDSLLALKRLISRI